MDDTPLFFRYRDPTTPPNAPPLLVRFEHISEQNVDWTKTSGKATYDSVLVALISAPGVIRSEAAAEIERTLPDGTVKTHRFNSAKYAEQVAHYKRGATAAELGTPLKEIPGITPAYILNLRARGIHTVETLADATETLAGDLMGYREWSEKARKYVAVREQEAPAKKMAADLKQRDDKIANLERQIAELVERYGSQEKRGPGRPPKVPEQQAA